MRADAHQQRALQLEHAMSMLVETHAGLAGVSIPAIPWLDTVTADAVADVTQSLIQRHPEVRALILFGSVARHDERPLADPHPSDVDLLFVVDASVINPDATQLTHAEQLALYATIGEADHRRRSPREIDAILLDTHLTGWDSQFIENVARDGILLWSRGVLPDALKPIKARS